MQLCKYESAHHWLCFRQPCGYSHQAIGGNCDAFAVLCSPIISSTLPHTPIWAAEVRLECLSRMHFIVPFPCGLCSSISCADIGCVLHLRTGCAMDLGCRKSTSSLSAEGRPKNIMKQTLSAAQAGCTVGYRANPRRATLILYEQFEQDGSKLTFAMSSNRSW
jgi:hypothetical protein